MKHLILSVDTGIDDALAIAYAVKQQELLLTGITVSYGMAPLEYTLRNTRHVLSLLGADHIPVYTGSTSPVYEKRSYNGNFHGMDGAANLLGVPSGPLTGKNRDAVSFLLDSVQKYEDQLVLVTTGPLTDLAEAIRRNPDIMKKIGHIFIMGGALTCPGNSSSYAEANIKADPFSSKIVAESHLPITFVGLDVTRKTLLTTQDIVQWKSYGTTAGDYFYELLSFYIREYHHFYPYLDGCALHDPLAVACACHPELIQSLSFSLTVSLDGPDKGRLTEDLLHPSPVPQTNVALKVDSHRFKRLFLDLMETCLSPSQSAAETLYLAGPALFYPNGEQLLSGYAAKCSEKNLSLPQGKTPLLATDSPELRAKKHRMRCLESLEQCSGILADLSPFRGTQPDSGTLFELGYAYAKGKKCSLYCNAPASWMSLQDLPTDFETGLECYTRSHGIHLPEEKNTPQWNNYTLIFCSKFPETLFSSNSSGQAAAYGTDSRPLTKDLAPAFWLKPDTTHSGSTLFEQIFPAWLHTAADQCHMALIDGTFPPGCQEPSAQASFLCGYLYAKEKPFYLLSNDLRPLKDKIHSSFSKEKSCWVDPYGNMIENFSLPFNLMLSTTAQGFLPLF